MTRNIAKRSAANRKAWRTRKRMAWARRLPKGKNALTQELIDYLKPEEVTGRLELPTSHNEWPAYMTRALPNPWSKDLPSW